MRTFPEGERHTWTDKEIAAYEGRWPIGSVARTAFALLLFTGQRMSDVSRMAWSDVGDGAIRVVQGKTGAKLAVPLHPELAEVLAAWPRSISASSRRRLGNPSRRRDLEIGWPTKLANLAYLAAASPMVCARLQGGAWRKRAVLPMRLRRSSATPRQRKSLATRKAAEQETLARSAISRLVHSPSATESQTHPSQFGKPRKIQ